MSGFGSGTQPTEEEEAARRAAEELDDTLAIDDVTASLPAASPYPTPANQREPETPVLFEPKDDTYVHLGIAQRYEYAAAYSTGHFLYEAAAAVGDIAAAIAAQPTEEDLQRTRSSLAILQVYLVDILALVSERIDYHKTVVSEGPAVAAAIYNQVTAKTRQPTLQSTVFKGALAAYQAKVANARVAIEVTRTAHGRGFGGAGDAATGAGDAATGTARPPTHPASGRGTSSPSTSANRSSGFSSSWKGKSKAVFEPEQPRQQQPRPQQRQQQDRGRSASRRRTPPPNDA
jgi:hypothetical protein